MSFYISNSVKLLDKRLTGAGAVGIVGDTNQDAAVAIGIRHWYALHVVVAHRFDMPGTFDTTNSIGGGLADLNVELPHDGGACSL